MYDWLGDALGDSATVVTANRRLARLLLAEYSAQQVAKGVIAWPTPRICAWQDWLHDLFELAPPDTLPTRINMHHSQWLWERSLRREFDDSMTGVSHLVRLSRDAWQKLADWQVDIRELARAAQSADQRLFASVAGRYVATLEREGWVDDAGLAWLVPQLVEAGQVKPRGRITFAGFDREKPVRARLAAALAATGVRLDDAAMPQRAANVRLQCLEDVETELRVAGAWARRRLAANPAERIAIVATDLDRNAERSGQLVREGLVPGWQYGDAALAAMLNVSFGKRLTDYPAVSTALLVLSWLTRDLRSTEVAHLLRTPLLGQPPGAGRSRLEMRLRRLPDRAWSPSMITGALGGRETADDAADWLSRVAKLTQRRRSKAASGSPVDWAAYVDELLDEWQWPGPGSLDSADFQLVNRWRDLLNDLARLALVSPSLPLETALARLEVMAGETVFQPEAQGGSVALLGPLEAAGAEFDALWITGVSATNWPPSGNPSPLIGRRLQRERGMPDADPADTVAHSRRLLSGLCAAAGSVVCSYAAFVDDAEQAPSTLLAPGSIAAVAADEDPGWHVARLVDRCARAQSDDRVPPVRPGETIAGGAYTLQCQMNDPSAAFIQGRLGAKAVEPQVTGLPASLKGSLIHDALHHLYVDCPSRGDIACWDRETREQRVADAVGHAIARHERNADVPLQRLFALERARLQRLLEEFIDVDAARADFAIDAVERDITFRSGDIELELRVDRIDRLPGGDFAILDYKTGAEKKFLQKGQPREIQLVAYSTALQVPIGALALVNVDPRHITFDGVGTGYGTADGWAETLRAWQDQVHEACAMIARGDVRVNVAQSARDARTFNLLTRYTELRREG